MEQANSAAYWAAAAAALRTEADRILADGGLSAIAAKYRDAATFLEEHRSPGGGGEPAANGGGLRYLLWDNERGMWWRPYARGYTRDREEAGRYSESEAVKRALQGALGGLEQATVIVADH